MIRTKHVQTPTRRRPRHAQRLVTFGERSAEVDAGLAPLISALWRLGIDTTFSCEGTTAQGPDLAPREEPWGYISFRTAEDLRQFLDLFAHTELAERRFRSDRNHRRATSPIWEIAITVHRFAEDETLDDGTVRLPSRVGFPSRDIESMTRIVRYRVAARSCSAEIHEVDDR